MEVVDRERWNDAQDYEKTHWARIVHESGVCTTRGGYTVTEDEMELHQRTLGDSEIGATDLAGVKQLYQDGISVEEIASTYLTTPDEIVCISKTW